jgi:hypothetical protein
LPDGRICNEDCEIVTVPTPVCNSQYNGQEVEDLTEGERLCEE